LLKKLGGTNFQKYEREISRISNYVNDRNAEVVLRGSSDYEMPYYRWEKDLDWRGQIDMLEYSQSFIRPAFRGFFTLINEPLDDRKTIHERMKK
jgi:hypothetical protein